MPITKNMFVATIIALVWVSLTTFAAFTNEIVNMRFFPRGFEAVGSIGGFETIGKIFLIIVLYLVDVLVIMAITPVLKAIRVHFVVSLVLVIYSLLVLYATMVFSVNLMAAMLLISGFMGILKGLYVFQAIQLNKIKTD